MNEHRLEPRFFCNQTKITLTDSLDLQGLAKVVTKDLTYKVGLEVSINRTLAQIQPQVSQI